MNIQEIQGDHLVRAIARNGQVRLTAVESTEMVRELQARHQLGPMETVALGRFMTALQLMSMDLKADEDCISAILRCDGPLEGMTASVSGDSKVRGFARRKGLAIKLRNRQKFDLSAIVGNGQLTVIRQQAGAPAYSGTVDLISGEIAEDFTYYMAVSEQIPTVLGLGVLLDDHGVVHAGGYLAQLMPGVSEETIDYVEQRAGGFPEVTYLLQEGFSAAQLLDLFIGDPQIRYLEQRPGGFACHCSRSKMHEALVLLPDADLREMIADGEGANLHCEFCNTDYFFDTQQLNEILAEK